MKRINILLVMLLFTLISFSQSDGSIKQIVSPSNGASVNATTDISFWISNEGTVPFSDYDYSIYVNSVLAAAGHITPALAIGDSVLETYTSVSTPIGIGSYANLYISRRFKSFK